MEINPAYSIAIVHIFFLGVIEPPLRKIWYSFKMNNFWQPYYYTKLQYIPDSQIFLIWFWLLMFLFFSFFKSDSWKINALPSMGQATVRAQFTLWMLKKISLLHIMRWSTVRISIWLRFQPYCLPIQRSLTFPTIMYVYNHELYFKIAKEPILSHIWGHGSKNLIYLLERGSSRK